MGARAEVRHEPRKEKGPPGQAGVSLARQGEWGRGRTDVREAICEAVRIEPLTPAIARLAGEGLAAVKRATTVDAFVMASAALRGDVVYTVDVDDLEKLRSFFPGVRVLSI
jgi:hypothetical protein